LNPKSDLQLKEEISKTQLRRWFRFALRAHSISFWFFYCHSTWQAIRISTAISKSLHRLRITECLDSQQRRLNYKLYSSFAFLSWLFINKDISRWSVFFWVLDELLNDLVVNLALPALTSKIYWGECLSLPCVTLAIQVLSLLLIYRKQLRYFGSSKPAISDFSYLPLLRLLLTFLTSSNLLFSKTAWQR